MTRWLYSYFRLAELGTDLRTELLAGLTTFMTMAYILVVNPQILARAGMDLSSVLFATCVSAGAASLLMGLLAHYPIALAPGMGLNAYFALTVVPQLTQVLDSREAAWRAALGAVFISGSLFIVLSLLRAREAIVNAIPTGLKLAISGGIGLFIALIGLQNGGVVVDHPATLVTLGDLHRVEPLITLGGVVLIGVLMARGLRSAALISIACATGAALLAGEAELPRRLIALPLPRGTLLALDPAGALSAGLVNVIFAFFFVDLFDTLGTLIGIAEQAGLLDANGRLPRARRALLADAIGTLLGSLLGTSTVTSYIESASGIATGGRSGLTAVVAGVLFLLSLLAAPLLQIVPPVATAPVLVVVGTLMCVNLEKIAWADLSEALPAFLTLSGIAFTYSIADGMALGFVSHALVKALSGRWREVTVVGWLVAALFVVRYALLP